VDGLRLDATHAIADDSRPHFLAELTSVVRAAAGRDVLLIAEDERNIARMKMPADTGGYGLDAVWADDFHHQVRVHVAGDRESYFAHFNGTIGDIATTLRRGWLFAGQPLPVSGRPRGTDPAGLAPPHFVFCVQNHDQVGNRADGERLHHQIELAAYRAACVLLLVAPQTPLLFMGQEWAASSPFLYFTDHHAALGEQVTRGRRQEFAGFAKFAAAALATIPDPQASDTFERSKLQWAERERPPHAGILQLHRRLLALRATHPALRRPEYDTTGAQALDEHTVTITRTSAGQTLLAVVRLSSAGAVRAGFAGGIEAGDVLLTTEDGDVAADPLPIRITPTHVEFARPGAVVVQLRGRGIAECA